MIRRIGQRTLQLENRPFLLAHAAAVGKKEGEGPLGAQFDFVTEDDRMGQKSWELAESELQKTAIETALNKAGLQKGDLDMILAGDLLNPVIGTIVPAPACLASFSYRCRQVSSAPRNTIVIEVAAAASVVSSPRPCQKLLTASPTVQIAPPNRKALRQSFHSGESGLFCSSIC